MVSIIQPSVRADEKRPYSGQTELHCLKCRLALGGGASLHYLITDVGSTTTKAILIGQRDGEYRLLGTGYYPTTVELPHEDVTIGLKGAILDLGERIGVPALALDKVPAKDNSPDSLLCLSTSSAGGGLQVMVFGVMRNVTAESAKKAALGGGAIILDVMTTDDNRSTFLKLESIKKSRPDMILISGGIDGGNTAFALEIADVLNAAKPRPRFGTGYKIPVIFAGNKDAAPFVSDTLSDNFDVRVVDNLRPDFETEVLEPTRQAIRELFISHVMAHAPGYRKLCEWVDSDVVPTPLAVGNIMQTLARTRNINILGVDIGGATTDVFSVIDGVFNRSVSANLGMSYSSGNVLVEAGLENIERWLPLALPAAEVSDIICTKLISPTAMPETGIELQVEHSLATEALRLAFDQHKQVATLPVKPKKGLALAPPHLAQDKIVTVDPEERSFADIDAIDMIIGSGGVLSHAPERSQAALILINAFQPTGLTHLAVDSVFMMPHLGVLSDVEPDIALGVLDSDCLVPLGPVISAEGRQELGRPAVSVAVRTADGTTGKVVVCWGDIGVVKLPDSSEVSVEVDALGGATVGGQSKVQFRCNRAEVGIMVDARGRPVELSADPLQRAAQNAKWRTQIGALGQSGGDDTGSQGT